MSAYRPSLDWFHSVAGLIVNPSPEQIAAVAGPDPELEPGDWRDGAACAEVDTEIFYPERGSSTREAKKVCASCTVRDACLEYALENGEKYGIWGGSSERERHHFKREAA